LQDQGEEIAAYEEDAIGSGLETGVLLAVDDDDACEAKVDGCREEGRGDGEADEFPSEELEELPHALFTKCEETYISKAPKLKGLLRSSSLPAYPITSSALQPKVPTSTPHVR
jgi:hypothetical protein